MPDAHVPDLLELRYMYTGRLVSSMEPEELDAEFDRAIAKIKADAVREAASELTSMTLTPQGRHIVDILNIRALKLENPIPRA